jgi:hypothetical protein
MKRGGNGGNLKEKKKEESRKIKGKFKLRGKM